ncbi:MAG: TolC family protein, partial [Muribaculaceae bacterium]
MKNIILIAVISICFVPARGQQQSLLLEEYRVMAVEYNHNLKAAQKNIA